MNYKFHIKMSVILCRLFSVVFIIYHSIAVFGDTKSYVQTFAFAASVSVFWWLGYESRDDKND